MEKWSFFSILTTKLKGFLPTLTKEERK